MKKSAIAGIVAFGSALYWWWLRKQENEAPLEGVEITVNPQKLIDGALAMSNINPMAKEGIRNLTARAMSKYYQYDEDSN